MILAAVLCLTIAVAGGFIVGVPVGIVLERERAARRPRERHEVLAEVYALPTPEAILRELRGPLMGCDFDDQAVPFELRPENRRRSSYPRVVEQ